MGTLFVICIFLLAVSLIMKFTGSKYYTPPVKPYVRPQKTEQEELQEQLAELKASMLALEKAGNDIIQYQNESIAKIKELASQEDSKPAPKTRPKTLKSAKIKTPSLPPIKPNPEDFIPLHRALKGRAIVIDCETTGFMPFRGDRIIELALVEIINGTPTGKHWHSYFKPDRKIPEDATNVNGITDEMVENAPEFHEKAHEIIDFIADAKLIAHNMKFDLSFLNRALQKAEKPLYSDHKCACTLLTAQNTGMFASNKLGNLCQDLNINLDNSHSALGDAKATAQLAPALIKLK